MSKVISLKQEATQKLHDFLDEQVANDVIKILDDIKIIEEQVYGLLKDKHKLHLLQFISQEEYASIIQIHKIEFIDKYL